MKTAIAKKPKYISARYSKFAEINGRELVDVLIEEQSCFFKDFNSSLYPWNAMENRIKKFIPSNLKRSSAYALSPNAEYYISIVLESGLKYFYGIKKIFVPRK
ncbi:MAG: hypothetical protein WCG45_02255 [bacterium]